MVYHYIFCNEIFRLNQHKWSCTKTTTLVSDNDVSLDLPRVSRQLYQETALLPYKLAVFDFGTRIEAYSTLRKFLKNRSEAHILAMRIVGFSGRSRMLRNVKRKYTNREFWPAVYWAKWLRINAGPRA